MHGPPHPHPHPPLRHPRDEKESRCRRKSGGEQTPPLGKLGSAPAPGGIRQLALVPRGPDPLQASRLETPPRETEARGQPGRKASEPPGRGRRGGPS